MERIQVSRCKRKKTPSTSAQKKQNFKTADITVAGSRICTWRGAFPLLPCSQVSFLKDYKMLV